MRKVFSIPGIMFAWTGTGGGRFFDLPPLLVLHRWGDEGVIFSDRKMDVRRKLRCRFSGKLRHDPEGEVYVGKECFCVLVTDTLVRWAAT